MYKAKVNDVGALYCETKEGAKSSGNYVYSEFFKVTDVICGILNIQVPDIAIYPGLIPKRNPETGERSLDSGETFHMDEHPEIKNSIMMIALEEEYDPAYLTSVIAHELRHIHQRKYLPELGINGHAKGGKDTLYHPEEIDADGFAIAYLVSCGYSFESAGAITCPLEKGNYPRAYKLRMEKAHEIYEETFEKKKEDSSVSHTEESAEKEGAKKE